MEPVNEVYVVLSGKDLVYVTMNLPDAEGLQYRLNEAGVDAAVGPAVLVTQDRYSELTSHGVDWFPAIRAKNEYISKLTKEVDQLGELNNSLAEQVSMLTEEKFQLEEQLSARPKKFAEDFTNALVAAVSHRDEIRRLEISEKALQDALEEKKSRIKELVADNDRLIEEVKNKSLVIEKKDRGIDKLAKKIKQMDGEIAALKTKIESLSSALSSAHRREHDWRRLLESRSTRLIDAEERLAKFQEAQRDQLDERGE